MTCWVLVHANPSEEIGFLEVISVYSNFNKAFQKLVELNEAKFKYASKKIKSKITNEMLCFKIDDERDPMDYIEYNFFGLLEKNFIE